MRPPPLSPARSALKIPRDHLTGHGPSETVASPPDIPGGSCRRKLHGFLHKVIVSNDTDTSTAIGEDLGALGLRRPVCGRVNAWGEEERDACFAMPLPPASG